MQLATRNAEMANVLAAQYTSTAARSRLRMSDITRCAQYLSLAVADDAPVIAFIWAHHAASLWVCVCAADVAMQGFRRLQ